MLRKKSKHLRKYLLKVKINKRQIHLKLRNQSLKTKDMSWLDLLRKFKVNRPLTEKEIKNHLEVKKSLDILPDHGLSVIKMNSTYMDTVDKFYAWKGDLTALTLFAVLPVLGGFIIYISYLTILGLYIDINNDTENIIFIFLSCITVFGAGIAASCWISLKECFKYTHYPIRFNRQNRMVYVFRLDGSILKAPWDTLHFNLTEELMRSRFRYFFEEWGICAHVLSEDKQTVLETFGLAATTLSKYYTLARWEFIRRYMEEGPKQCYYNPDKDYKLGDINNSHLTFCNDIDGKRESATFNPQRIKWYYYACYPLIKLSAFPRLLAMKSCKVPQWPAKIEAECPIAVDDPYIVSAAGNVNFILSYAKAASQAKEKRNQPHKGIKFRADDTDAPKPKKKKKPNLPRYRQ